MPSLREEIIGDCRLILGDCREVLPTLKAGAVVTDPPFSVPVKYHAAKGEYPRSWGDLLVMEPFFADVLVKIRHSVGDGQVYLSCDGDSYPIFHKCAYPLWSQAHLLIWYKPSGRRGRGWLHSHELILHLRTASTCYATGFRQDVVGIMPVRTLNREHPAQKPGDLVGFIADAIPALKYPICDPFMGSGTTGVSCALLGRRFVGIEVEPRYFNIACRRVEAATRQADLLRRAA